jgi:hypothetical protein
LHDNTRPHTAVTIRQLLAKRGIPELNHPAYSPDFVPARLLLIPQNQIHAEYRKDNKINVPEELLALHGNEYKKFYSNFISDQKIMWHLKEIILKNTKRYVEF